MVERNPLVRNLDILGLVTTSYWGEIVDAGLYRPLTLLSFGVNRLFSDSPFGFHVVNDALHGVAAALCFLVASALGLSRVGSLAAALLFALHPVQSEAVNAIVGRSEILAFSFAVGAFLLYLRQASPFRVGGLFFLALLSKESALFALPLFVLPRRDVPRLLAVGIAVVGSALLRLAVLGGLGISGREIGFLDNPIAEAGLGARLLTAPALFLRYLGLVLYPRVLSADYSFDQIPIPASLVDARVLLGAGTIALLLFLGSRGKTLGFAILAFVLPLAGFLHILFPLGALFAERFLYLPLLGVALSFGMGIDALSGRVRWIGASVAFSVLTVCAVRLQARHRDFRDNETLFRRTIETSPRSARSHFLLGAELLEKKEFPEAAEWFEKGLAIYPSHFGARMSLGQALLAGGEPAGAETAFLDALALAPDSEDAREGAIEAALVLGRERARAEDFASARASFERAIALDPTSPSAWNYLGLVLEREGRIEDAAAHYRRALSYDPDHVPALLNLASSSLNRGDLEDAERTYRRALELAPDSYESYNGLGITLARQGRAAEASRAFEKAIALDPGLEAARENLRALSSKP